MARSSKGQPHRLEVSDFVSNSPEQIEHAVKTIGKSKDRRKVFEAIYHGSARAKTVDEIVRRTRLKKLRVFQEGRHLVLQHVALQTEKDGEFAYEKIGVFQANKKKILRLIDHPEKLAAMPTKRRQSAIKLKQVTIPTRRARARQITIDDVDSFARVKKIKMAGSLPSSMTEEQFKKGVQAIIGEPGEFKDWGGEKSDLYTTRLRFKGKRRTAAFAFKGPGLKTKLVPGKMGKNGDQAVRLMNEQAEIFFVQHWRDIDPAVIDMMHKYTAGKSALTGQELWYGIIDGQDSERLRLAYPAKFASVSRRKKAIRRAYK